MGMEVGMAAVLGRVSGQQKTPHAARGFKFLWSWRSDLNRRPAVYETAALPTELRQQSRLIILRHYSWFKVKYLPSPAIGPLSDAMSTVMGYAPIHDIDMIFAPASVY
jgi:hypothetical protein